MPSDVGKEGGRAGRRQYGAGAGWGQDFCSLDYAPCPEGVCVAQGRREGEWRGEGKRVRREGEIRPSSVVCRMHCACLRVYLFHICVSVCTYDAGMRCVCLHSTVYVCACTCVHCREVCVLVCARACAIVRVSACVVYRRVCACIRLRIRLFVCVLYISVCVCMSV